MRAIVTKGGIYTWINVRENKFIEEKFNKNSELLKDDLNEREQYIAQTLVGRGVLEREGLGGGSPVAPAERASLFSTSLCSAFLVFSFSEQNFL